MSILTKLSQPSSNLSPATQKKMIVVTNNYDMPILTEFLQLNPSQSPELKSIKTSNSTKSLQPPHKFVKMMMKVNSPTTIDEEKIISNKNQLLTDSIESNLSLFTDVWSEKNTQALRANWKKVFGEDLLMNWWPKGGGGVLLDVVVLPPLKHLLLDDVPHPPQRQQPCQLPHYRQRQIIEIPLHSCDETIFQY